MDNDTPDFRTGYIDLLLNILVGIIFISIVSTALINLKVVNQQDGLKKNAEYVAQVEWNPAINCDVDTWVKDGRKHLVYFRHKDDDVMHIERDDQGFTNDWYTPLSSALDSLIPGGSHQTSPPPAAPPTTTATATNEETWVLRGLVPGTYTLNLHLYACHIPGTSTAPHTYINLPVTVKLIRINPKYEVVKEVTVTLERTWEEVTVFNFDLDKSGDATNFTTDQHKFVDVGK